MVEEAKNKKEWAREGKKRRGIRMTGVKQKQSSLGH